MTVTLKTLLDRSVNRLGDVHPTLKEYTIELITRAYNEGIFVQISSGYRSHVDQAYIYGQGRSSYTWNGKIYGSKGSIVSNAEPGESVHNYGLAIDYFLVSDDGNKALWVVNDKWKRVAAIAKSMGFEWGGDWSSFRDYPHLQLNKGLTIKQLMAGKRPTIPPLKKEEVKKEESKPLTPTKGAFRIKTGTFSSARSLADAADKVNADFKLVVYEAADSTSYNPKYRLYTGVFSTKEAAVKVQEQFEKKYGWTTYLLDETKN